MNAFPSKSSIGTLAIIYVVVALFFLIWPGILKQINHALKRWISIRKITKPLDMMRDVDMKIFRMSRVIGGLSLILALFFVYLYINY